MHQDMTKCLVKTETSIADNKMNKNVQDTTSNNKEIT